MVQIPLGYRYFGCRILVHIHRIEGRGNEQGEAWPQIGLTPACSKRGVGGQTANQIAAIEDNYNFSRFFVENNLISDIQYSE